MNGSDSDGSSNPLVVVISGPSGVGKDAILNRMKELSCPFEYITTVTTRLRRVTECDGIHYHFVSRERFQKMVEQKELLEWANVYGNWYGVPKEPVKQGLAKGHDIIVKVDIQGSANIKKILPEAVFVFIAPPSFEELSHRLTQRKTESAGDLALRLKTAEEEMKQLAMFDYVVINRPDGIDQAISQIQAIVTAEKCRAKPRKIAL